MRIACEELQSRLSEDNLWSNTFPRGEKKKKIKSLTTQRNGDLTRVFFRGNAPISFPTPTHPLRKQRSPQGGRHRCRGCLVAKPLVSDVTAGTQLSGQVKRKAQLELHVPIRPPAPEAARLFLMCTHVSPRPAASSRGRACPEKPQRDSRLWAGRAASAGQALSDGESVQPSAAASDEFPPWKLSHIKVAGVLAYHLTLKYLPKFYLVGKSLVIHIFNWSFCLWERWGQTGDLIWDIFPLWSVSFILQKGTFPPQLS